MDADGWERGADEEFVKGIGAGCCLHKNDDLVELECVEKINQLSVLLVLFEFAEVLLQSVKGQSRLIIDCNLERLLHELLAGCSDLCIQGG